MLPAYLDAWCQTAPQPVPEPDIALFIHGPQSGEPDVQVCWRSDLVTDDRMAIENWTDVVALLPPTSAECLTAPISRVRRWLAQEDELAGSQSDLLEVADKPDQEPERRERSPIKNTARTPAVLWRGTERTRLLISPVDLQPGDTLVLPVSTGGWNELGHIPDARSSDEASPEPQSIDIAEDAYELARQRRVLRLHPACFPRRKDQPNITTLLSRIADPDEPPDLGEWHELLRAAADDLPENDRTRVRLLEFAKTRGKSTPLREKYPDGRGYLLTARNRTRISSDHFVPPLDDGDDDASRNVRQAVSLTDHTQHVIDALATALEQLPTSLPVDVYRTAAERHDWGKADDRFQALLQGVGRTDTWLTTGASPRLLAKSDALPLPPDARRQARERAGLPEGFRHEMLSVQLAERAGFPAVDPALQDVILHLIAAHHGHARPFAPVVIDTEPPDVALHSARLEQAERRQHPSHRLDSGIAERFWSLTRTFGWWGAAYLEALLRLADQQASAREDAGNPNESTDAPHLVETLA